MKILGRAAASTLEQQLVNDNREISQADVSGANYTPLLTGFGCGANDWFYSGTAGDVPNNAIYCGGAAWISPRMK